jgi:hypothetical protein
VWAEDVWTLKSWARWAAVEYGTPLLGQWLLIYVIIKEQRGVITSLLVAMA